MNRRRPICVEVHWQDAKSLGGWSPDAEAEALGLVDCFTVGHLLEKTKTYIKVAATTSFVDGGSDGVGDVIAIPIGMVKKMRKLK